MSVQYTGRRGVQWGMFSTPGDITEYTGGVQYTVGYHEYTGGVQYSGGYHEYTERIP